MPARPIPSRAGGRERRALGGLAAALALVLGLPPVVPSPAAAQAPGERAATAEQLVVRFTVQGRQGYGRVDGNVVRELPGSDVFTASVSAPTGRTYRLDQLRFLSPLEPELVEKVVGVERNTRRPGRDTPVRNPRYYARFPSTLNHHQGDVEVPADATNFTYAGGVAVIIGREGRHISESQAPDYIWGVSVGNDFHDATWSGERRGDFDPGRIPARATDGWFPMGPWVAVGLNWRELRIETRLNGETVQLGRTTDLVNSIPSLISNLSRFITLRPGDIIFAGTVPYREGARRQLRPGDLVEVEVEGIGTLSNRIVPMQEPGR